MHNRHPIKSILSIVGSLILAGCQSTPVVQTKIVYVNKEVFIPCVKNTPVAPTWEVEQLTAKAEPSQKAKALMLDRLQAKAYIRELEAVVQGCKQ